MSKAILIMDMPNGCRECIFKSLHSDVGKTWCCGLIVSLEDEMICVDDYNFSNSNRPNWCPLHKLPEKDTNSYFPDEYSDGYRDGYNACMDEISKQ